jgi:uncharacterized protein
MKSKELEMDELSSPARSVTASEFSKLAIITALVKNAPVSLGRTGLMKCLFFLKTLKNVPLPYNFRLYTYGPFDSNVLEDLQYAESLGAIKSTLVAYPGGYGYHLQAGPEAENVESRAADFVSKYRDKIAWTLREFGSRSAIDLEMASTLIYIDRSFASKHTKVKLSELAKSVHDVKPHLSTSVIEVEARQLKERGLLTAAD